MSALANGAALAALLAGARCENDVSRLLVEWRARVEAVFPATGEPLGGRTVLLPTSELGAWLRLTVDPRGEALMERVTAAAVESFRFDPSCLAVTLGRRERSIDADAWTDDALAARLLEGDTGVILIWSPHMPLSVDAYAVLEALTREMGISLVAILDPAADGAYARSVSRERGLPSSALRPLDGIELAFRGMTTHSPSIQVFTDGKLRGPVIPGYRDRAAFRISIERALGRSP